MVRKWTGVNPGTTAPIAAPTLAPSHPRTIALAVTALALTLGSAPAAAQGLTGATGLQRAYDAIMDARFEDVPRLTAAACPPAPTEACQLLGVVSTWWQIQIDPHSRALDLRFQDEADAAVSAMEAWTARDAHRAEAWFYLGGALGARAQWQVLRGERLAAARSGKRIKESLERALVLDPSLQDANVGIGLYRYYAAVAPAALRMLRWFLLLPGGDRAEGLAQLRSVSSSGVSLSGASTSAVPSSGVSPNGVTQLLRDEADYQLHSIELLYEKQPERAIALLRGLDARHPRNPHFLQLVAEIEDYRLRDFDASRRTYDELLRRASEGRVSLPAFADVHARLGVARLALPADALPHLQRIIDTQPLSPIGAIAQAQLQRGDMLTRLGRHEEARAAYRAAIERAPDGDPLESARKAQRALRAR
jgi:tetratricopeptide (TPR) repeat protein